MSREIHEVGGSNWSRKNVTTSRKALQSSSWRTFFRGRMNITEPNEHSINADKRELEDTASTRSSFADLFDNSIAVEIRDGSYQREGYTATTTSLLQTCKRQVVLPYFTLLTLITWRPFCREALRYQPMWRMLNVAYTSAIFALLIFSYVASALACQARLEPLTTKSPVTWMTIQPPTPTANASHHNHTTPAVTTRQPITNSSQANDSTSKDVVVLFTMAPAQVVAWTPAVVECTHIFSAYVVPNFFHFLAFIMGFYHFRIQESEGLHALIEKVFLYSSAPNKLVTRLRIKLIGGIIWVLLDMGNFVVFCCTFGLSSITGIRHSQRLQILAVCIMALGKLVQSCVTLTIIMNFSAQCRLIIHYLNEINLRMEEKTSELSHAMKDMLDAKKNIDRINGIISWITTLIIFNHCEILAVGVSIMGMKDPVTGGHLAYRIAGAVLYAMILSVPITMAACLTSAGTKLKQKSLHTRMFGYSSASQLDLDSLVLFSHCAELKVKLFFIPVKPSYVWGLLAGIFFVVLLLLQMGVVAGKNRLL